MREFTAAEHRLATLLGKFEDLVDERRNALHLRFQPDAVKAMQATGLKFMKCQYFKNEDNFLVTFTLPQYYSYLQFCCRHTGLAIELDGSVRTGDHLLILTTAQCNSSKGKILC